ncbi:1,4-dihydroxy-6-naphthoate synthase [Desulfonatronovibrio hydrogenovorans]|uniref:1,4-dihydroxy-6-naphthoate synthase n=1 Tax=Desulfonatronovibrio hydrogenovorans TaxID=53245 RepID=UPI000A86B03A|nr:1,4-dihydroxy-6-naphthoate synthase [Desulfonatronovibrio hydrogenovorans]
MSSREGLMTLRAAISPCPNDTFIFGAWILGLVGDIPGVRTRFGWEDVQTLNEMAGQDQADLIKVSAVTALGLEHRYALLRAGGAFGLEHGPKLVVLRGAGSKPARVAVPGLQTTAYALLRAAVDHDFQTVPMPFDRIPGAVSRQEVDAGLLIHETALVHKALGFEVLLDLGDWWREKTSGLPLPLGMIVIRKDLGREMKTEAEEIIRRSISAAGEKRTVVDPLIRQLARELDPLVIEQHIRAYVNRFSLDTGQEGGLALARLRQVAGIG